MLCTSVVKETYCALAASEHLHCTILALPITLTLAGLRTVDMCLITARDAQKGLAMVKLAVSDVLKLGPALLAQEQ